jgi:hypothetical protein
MEKTKEDDQVYHQEQMKKKKSKTVKYSDFLLNRQSKDINRSFTQNNEYTEKC